jgi:hypothetical protein
MNRVPTLPPDVNVTPSLFLSPIFHTFAQSRNEGLLMECVGV